MVEYSAFDVLGPIMVGPSSSHTAGACRIANTAQKICGNDFKSVEFLLHGSFALTYKGHGTDKALVGGIMGYEPDDDRIRSSFEIAKEKGVDFKVKTVNLGEEYHPNSVKVVFHFEDKPDEYVIGSSIGGGAITIVNINGIPIEFRGEFSTLLLKYNEQQGVLSFVSSLLAERNYNIESINTEKDKLTDVVTLTIEIDKPLTEDLKTAILDDDRFLTTKYVEV
ncbi:L-serine ammonia-lyase, iron-sulfur-dependent subunit beta [Anaerosphaera multitolerans]|uniref:L-serine deaminase n=1 Tax=Anaerosphaera multitolerans TaxID=2487351 RepID=A0A437S9G9_9FIRM|nr:L-serine ammonia-lyase, iron-sulfur-dependent subunit beta [Anaerosphaera multitolerans]RVU55642.1 L-serine ammonia-lyase, iron-sulfur-dependent, subunit beta [Anaerosphaera multitolerans]